MSSLNLSVNGPSISKSYQSVVDAPLPTGSAASSATYGQWAVFSVSAPLANAFQDSGSKESVLKVQSTGDGELADLVDEFSDGRIQFAYVKVRDPNSGLPKSALIAWCGEGVPERTKGYFTNHLTAVAKLFHGYHVQVTARSDRDLTPDSIIQKIADASGSKYSHNASAPPVAAVSKPTIASKPAFTPTQSTGGTYSNPVRSTRKTDSNIDEDGWGADAPPITRSELEKVQSAYQPTKVNMRELVSQPPALERSEKASSIRDTPSDVVKGGYQPIGKVDIAAIRRQAQASGASNDERPGLVKGAYEPVGKVDIAAIRAKAQKPDNDPVPARPIVSENVQDNDEAPPSLASRSAAFSAGPERLTSMPKPKVANKFGSSSTFTGTRAPIPGGFEAKPPLATSSVTGASRNFANEGGKTPAQLWAEKKARERGASGSGDAIHPASQGPITQQPSGTQWESGYSGKKWGAVQTSHTGQSKTSSVGAQKTGEPDISNTDDAPSSPSEGVSSIRDRFVGSAPMGAPSATNYSRSTPQEAPEPETSTKPNRGIPIPGLASSTNAAPSLPTPPAQPRSPTPPTPDARDVSPIRVAVPVSKSSVTDAHQEQYSPPPALPHQSISRVVPEEQEDNEPETGPDPGRAAAQTAADVTGPEESLVAVAGESGEQARAEYDYDAAEDNEVSLREGEIVTNVQKIDPDWWLVTNAEGQSGLVPSNYLIIIEDDAPTPMATIAPATAPRATTTHVEPKDTSGASSATAEYDYEAGEDNELSFPEGATITNIEFPDDDWWHGEYQGRSGLFPAAYVKINS